MSRTVAAALIMMVAAWLPAGGEGLASLSGSVTVVMESEKPLPSEAVLALKKEIDRLFASTRLRIDWVSRGETGLGFEAADIVVVRLRGDCRAPSMPAGPPDELGPLAWTHVSHGTVLPFSEVECERVTRAAHSALIGGERVRAQQMVGRALGRVVAHELIHIFLQQKSHAAKGIFRRGLTPRQLVETFEGEDAEGRILLDSKGKPAS